MKNIQLVALDMDGTLLRHDEHGVFISDKTKVMVRKLKESGIHVVIATGRSYDLLKEFITELDLEGSYHVMCNGAATLAPNGEFVNLHGLPHADYRLIVERFSETQIPFAAFDADLSFCLPYTADTHGHAYRESAVRDDLVDIPFITKLVAGPHDADVITNLVHDLDISLALSVFQGVDYAEIWPKGLHKGTAVEEVAKIYGIPLENVMAIGDGGNDKGMLAHVGWGVAMGNASDDVKSYAKAVTDSIDDDGAANAIEKYVFLKDFS